MRRLIVGVAAAAIAAGSAGPALAKAHSQPADRAQERGQANADATDPTGARAGDARMLTDDEMGVDGDSYSDLRRQVRGSESGQKSGDMAEPGSPN